MGRIAFRHALPIVQLALAAALVTLGNAQRAAELAAWEARRAAASHVIAEGAVIKLEFPPPPDMPSTTEIAVGINAPGLAVILLVLIVLMFIFEDETWLVYLVCAIGTLLFWYLMGVFIDRRRGLLPVRTNRPPRLVTRIMAWAGLVICPILAYFSFKRIFEPQGWHGEHDVYTYVGFSAWLMVATASIAFKLRRWRALARSSSTMASG